MPREFFTFTLPSDLWWPSSGKNWNVISGRPPPNSRLLALNLMTATQTISGFIDKLTINFYFKVIFVIFFLLKNHCLFKPQCKLQHNTFKISLFPSIFIYYNFIYFFSYGFELYKLFNILNIFLIKKKNIYILSLQNLNIFFTIFFYL